MKGEKKPANINTSRVSRIIAHKLLVEKEHKHRSETKQQYFSE